MSRKKIQKWLNEAVAAHRSGNMGQAGELYRKVIKSDPKNADAIHLSGLIAYQQQQFDKALELVERAIKLNNKSPGFWSTLGLIKRAGGDINGAIHCYQRATDLQPNFADPWTNLGVAMQYLGDHIRAIECYRKSLALNPDNPNALRNLGKALSDTGGDIEAMEIFRSLLQRDPDDYKSLAYLASAKQDLCEWESLPELHARINQQIADGAPFFITPLPHLTMSNDPKLQLQCSMAMAAANITNPTGVATPSALSAAGKSGERIRIGYWSSDLQEHATSYLLAEVIELHDKERFEVTLFSYGRDDGSTMRQRLIDAADEFLDLEQTNLTEVAELIRQRGIDILIDLKGYTKDTRSQLLALRPAPIQVSWLGYPGSLGTPFADYIIGDSFVTPEGAEPYYSEKICRLPHCYQPNDRKRKIAAPLSREEYGLPASGFVFCLFSQAYKMLPQMFDSWMRILQRLPDSVLWLLSAGEVMEENLRREASTRGVDPARLIFGGRLPLDQHIARYRVADLALDTFPYSSHTTASDALWAGCPVVGLSGETFASRVSGSLLQAAGLPELITDSFEAFEELAVALAGDPGRLERLRAHLRQAPEKLPLFDTPAFTHGLEAAYRQMVEEAAKRSG